MKTILAIETSCDETAISLIQTHESEENFSVISDLVISQIDIHAEYGGVFPALAKREHTKNLPLLFEQICKDARKKNIEGKEQKITQEKKEQILEILSREPELAEKIISFFNENNIPNIDIVMVTHGPGLAPALWVGVNFARTLSIALDAKIMPLNHMEGHISSILLKENYIKDEKALYNINNFEFPLISLLISGGHTQIILVKNWGEYEILGETTDDAVGEAFDKVARLLGMSYPGGPKISKAARLGEPDNDVSLPRPMLHSKDYRFSFSGLKTAARYLIEDLKEKNLLDEQKINNIAREFEYAVTEVLLKKTKAALLEHEARGLIIAGGVSANTFITENFKNLCGGLDITLYLPEKNLCGDNSMMIASAGFVRLVKNIEQAQKNTAEISAIGNLKL